MKPGELFARIKGCMNGNRLVVLGIKYIPVICTILLTLHVAMLLMGVYEPFTAGVSVFLILVLLVLLSFRFGFCKLHKAMIIYMVAMTVCVCIQKCDGFGRLLTLFRMIMFGIGCVLVALSFLKGCGNGDCE